MGSSAWRGTATIAIGLMLGLALSVVLVAPPVAIPETSSSDVVVLPSPIAPTLQPSAAPSQELPTAKPVTVAGSRIAVPRLGIDLPLEFGEIARDVPREGFAGATPENVAFVFPSSRLPGEGGNTYIYAHARVGMFLSLWGAKLGDQVIIYRPDDGERRLYRVAVIAPRVNPADAHWLDPNG